MVSKPQAPLPISKRPSPEGPAWLYEESFLAWARVAPSTERAYRTGLRVFADWLQHYGESGYKASDPWPLSPESLTTEAVLRYRRWLPSHRASGTLSPYTAAVTRYLNYLDRENRLPPGVQLSRISREIRSLRRKERLSAKFEVDPDILRQALPQVVAYYDGLPLPPSGSPYNRRLVLLRNRAIVHLLYSTGIGGAELIGLDRRDVGDGLARQVVFVHKDQTRAVLLGESTQKALRDYLDERTDNNPALFVVHYSSFRDARIAIGRVRFIIKKAAEALGLPSILTINHFRQFWLEDHGATQIGQDGSVSPPLFPMNIVRGTQPYIEAIAEQANGCYQQGWYDACAVMVRSLIETLIIECFEHLKISEKIKDKRGHYLQLRSLVEAFQKGPWDLDRRTRSLMTVKELGDLAIHERHWSTTQDDIDRYAKDIRITIEKLIHIAGFRTPGHE